MSRKPGRRNRKGFTLIEVLGALVILSLGILTILGLTGTLGRQMDRASLRGQVTIAVQNRLDSLQLVPYDSLSPGVVSDELTLNGRTFDRSHRILQVSAMVREVEVTVEPADGEGPSMTVSGFVSRSR